VPEFWAERILVVAAARTSALSRLLRCTLHFRIGSMLLKKGS